MQHYKVGTYKFKRDSEGKFSKSWLERFWDKTKLYTVRAFLVLVVTFLIGSTARAMFPDIKYISEQVLVDNLSPKIESLKDSLVEDIRKCESMGHKENDGIIIFDSNNEASIGQFQYQRKTIVHYQKKLYNETITPKEAILIAIDEDKARQLTYDIVFQEKDGWRNWYNCGKKIGVEGQLAVINKLR